MKDAKKIIAHFLKIQPSDIVESTEMDDSAVGGSLILLRMYSKLAGSGYGVKNPIGITTFGDFCLALKGLSDDINVDQVKEAPSRSWEDELGEYGNSGFGIGVDIEDIVNLPKAVNFSTDKFYVDNFSAYEIDYCSKKANPAESFAALFSLKESIIKADNSFIQTQFNQIKIQHTEQGQPTFQNFHLSTSHSKNLVVSVAIKKQNIQISSNSLLEESAVNVKNKVDDSGRKSNYFTKTQTFLLLAIATLPIYIVSLILFI
jgi:phosphopantetheine--protein transferase-like protein